jgi:hypothetical protein
MTGALSKDELISRLVRAGEMEVEGAPPADSPAISMLRIFDFTDRMRLRPAMRD